MSVTIPAELAARVVWFCSRMNVASGETVIEKGTADRALYIISRGQFKVHDDSAGEDFVLAMLNRGDIFGEMSFLDGSIRSASVSSTTASSILRMGKEEYSRMLAGEPEVAVEFLRFLSAIVCKRLRTANDALLQVAFGDNEITVEQDSSLKKAIANMHEAVRIELEGS